MGLFTFCHGSNRNQQVGYVPFHMESGTLKFSIGTLVEETFQRLVREDHIAY